MAYLLLIVNQAVDEAVAGGWSRTLLAVSEVHDALESDVGHLVLACMSIPACRLRRR